MPARATVYCARTLKHLTHSMLWTWLQDADWWTLAEVWDIEDEAVVDAALIYLRLEPKTEEALGGFEIYYRPQELRQVQGHFAGSLAEARKWAKEAQEGLKGRADRSDAGFRQVCAHLERVQEVASIEFSIQPWSDLGWPMGEVIAYQAGRWIAMNGDGYLEDHGGERWTYDNWIPKRVYAAS